MPHAASPNFAPRPARRGFTLVELLVVMAVLLLLAVLTAVSVNRVAQDARLASGVNTVTSVLGTARGLAMQRNRPVLVAFRVGKDPQRPSAPQFTEAVIAEWTGRTTFPTAGLLADEFRPVDGVPPRALPPGIKVAAPRSDFDQDNLWVTQPDRLSLNPADPDASVFAEPDRAFGLLFGPDGSLLTRMPGSAISIDQIAFVNYNGNSLPNGSPIQNIGTGAFADFWQYNQLGDENNLNYARFVAVYDDRAARERYDVSTWTNETVRRQDLSRFIVQFGELIHFNRYSGMVQR